MPRISFDTVLAPEASIHLFGGNEPVSGMSSAQVGPGLQEPERVARAHGGSLIGVSRARQGHDVRAAAAAAPIGTLSGTIDAADAAGMQAETRVARRPRKTPSAARQTRRSRRPTVVTSTATTMGTAMNRSSTPGNSRKTLALKAAVAAAACALAGHAMADITFYENENFRGRNAGADAQINFLKDIGFDDRASSIEVRGERCRSARTRAIPAAAACCSRAVIRRCARWAWTTGSARRAASARTSAATATAPIRNRPTLRRGDEGLYQAQVVSVRAVMGDEQQRCWIEQKEVRDRPNVGGAVIGGVLGGILGYQFGGGSGQAVTTAAGAVGGAVVGSNVNRDQDVRNVQRCGASPNSGNPPVLGRDLSLKGQDHYMQTRRPPGATVTVNARGEPRE